MRIKVERQITTNRPRTDPNVQYKSYPYG